MILLLKGIILGMIIVLPGMSGGTLLLVLGVYKSLIGDLSRLRLWPWFPFIVGGGVGIILSGWLLSWLFMGYRNIGSALLLGSVLASVRVVLGTDCKVTWVRAVLLAAGFSLGLALATEPMGIIDDRIPPGFGLLALGGAVSSAAMLVPGIPGSSVLIVMGIYDDVLHYLGVLKIVPLAVFAAGGVAGMVLFTKVIDRFYSRYRAAVGWLFSGLIIGSGRMLLPVAPFHPAPVALAFAIGFVLVWLWGDRKQRNFG